MKDMFNLDGKVAIVTGGHRGIGKALARGLAEFGADIAIADVASDEALNAAVQDIKAAFGRKVIGIKCDVTKPEQIKAMVARVVEVFGKINILVNNAGINRRALPQDLTIEEWDAIHATNTRGTWLCSKEVYPIMKKAGGGKIINIGSINSGHPFGTPMVSAYTSSKGGVIGFTKSLALAWAMDNIQVNTILPGPIDTELIRAARREAPGYEHMIDRSPVKRWGQPEELIGAAVFLASHASDFVSAVALPVDGGYSAALF